MVIVSDILLPKNADGILKVSDVSTSADSDLSARTDIADPTTSTFIKTDAVGRLNILESNIEGAGTDNSLNATSFAVSQMGAFDGSAYRVAKCSNVGRLEVDVNSGGGSVALKAGNDTNNSMAAVGVFGSINGTADYRSIQVDSAGALLVRADNANDSIRIVGQNSLGNNKGVGVEDTDGGILSAAKVVVADPSSADGTRQLLRLNAKHELICNVANTANVKFEDISSSLNSGTADNPPNSLAVGMRGRTNIGSEATETFVKVNSLGELVTGNPDKTELDVFTVGERTVTGASVTSTNTLELRGTGKVCITIHSDTSSHSAILKLSNDGSNFYTPTTGSTFSPDGNMLFIEFDNVARLVQVVYTNSSGGTVVISQAKLVYA